MPPQIPSQISPTSFIRTKAMVQAKPRLVQALAQLAMLTSTKTGFQNPLERTSSRWFELWPFWDGENVKGDPNTQRLEVGDQPNDPGIYKRSRIESTGW